MIEADVHSIGARVIVCRIGGCQMNRRVQPRKAGAFLFLNHDAFTFVIIEAEDL